MKRRILIGLFSVIVLAGVLGLFVAFEFVWTRGRTPAIEGEHAVASLETVELDGTRQWILIRGRDARNPVVLWLHGGPGMPAMYLAHAFQPALEEAFVVVHWDRLGAGKSYAAGTDRPISVRRTLDQTFELTRLLRERFGLDRIYLVGHSWGSYLGLLAIEEHPEYYAGFVGTGVIAGTTDEADSLRRTWLEAEATAAGDSAVLARLAAGGEVTESDLFRFGGELHGARSFWPLLRTGLGAPEYTLSDVLNVRRGAQELAEKMVYDVEPPPNAIAPFEVAVPVAFFLGRDDYNTPSALAARLLDGMQAPTKRLVWFEHSAHFPFFSEPEKFAQELVAFQRAMEGRGAAGTREASEDRTALLLGGPCVESPGGNAYVELRDALGAAERAADPTAAIEIQRQIVRLRCDNSRRWADLARRYIDAGREAEAVAILAQVDSMAPNDLEAIRQRSSAMFGSIWESGAFRGSRLEQRMAERAAAHRDRLTSFRAALDTLRHRPPAEWVARDVCPFECCGYGTWGVQAETHLYASVGGDAVVAVLEAGGEVEGLTGDVHLRPLPIRVLHAQPVVPLEAPNFVPGDIVFLLDHRGEGHSRLWHDGRIVEAETEPGVRAFCAVPGPDCWGEYFYSDAALADLAVWWVKVRSPGGVVGWTNQPHHFSGIDGCG